MNIYADPYNVGGRVHPGVSEKFRGGLPAYATSDMSENEKRVKLAATYNPNKLMTETDHE